MIVKRLFTSSRYVILAAVLGSLLAAVVLILAGFIAVIRATVDVVRDPAVDVSEAKSLAVDLIEVIDVFLLGTILYIVALGLYELFIDPNLELPRWLLIQDLDDLKERLVGVIIVLLGVTFLGAAVSWTGEGDILSFGIAVGVVIVALSIMLWVTGLRHRHSAAPPEQHGPPH